MSRPLLLVAIPFAADLLAPLAPMFEIVHWRALDDARDFLKQRGGDVRAVITNGVVGLPPGSAQDLGNLQMIACNGVGYDAIDMAWARRRGIAVTHTPDVLSADVADLALGLLLAVCRRIPLADRHVRSGAWSKGPFPLGRRLAGSRIGIVGLGRIGRLIASRCAAFDTSVAYAGRSRQADMPYRYFDALTDLARWSDVLIVAMPGGASTRHLVSAEVLDALGPRGVLINIARGSVVDEDALVERLSSGGIAAAGLDVFADEPNVPAPLLSMQQVVLSPHIASATTETRLAMAELVIANVNAFAQGHPLPTPVP
jgi:lactate dehydrogenase-like 2-hydroxyacid dehydrogenase